MTIKDKSQFLWISLEPGEEIASSLTQTATELNLGSAWIQGIGVVRDMELGFYDPRSKEYIKKKFDGAWEILSLSGNLTLSEGKPFVHLHGSFSNQDFSVIGGHFFSGKIAAAAEFCLFPGDLPVHRRFSEKLNLNIWDLP